MRVTRDPGQREIFCRGGIRGAYCITPTIDYPAVGSICGAGTVRQMKTTEVTLMKSDGPLILAVLFLASGLTIIFAYGVGTAGFNAAYPFSAANLNLSIATTGPAAMGGLGLTALGLLVLLWGLICALVGELSGMGADRNSPNRIERKRLEQEQKLERTERKRLEQQERLMKQEERLRASYPRD